MTTRENDLHEPRLRPSQVPGGYVVRIECSVCSEPLGEGYSDKSQEDAYSDARGQLYSYCPNCGARLRGES